MDFTDDEITLLLKSLLEHIEKLKSVEGAPKKDIKEYQVLIDRLVAYRKEHFKKNWLDELLRVGLQKPMGYFHAAEVKDNGYSFADIEVMASQRGLKTQIFSKGFSGESIYFYDEDTLQRFLEKNKRILTEAHWPSDPKGFIAMVSQKEVEAATPFFDLIAEAFGDEGNKRL